MTGAAHSVYAGNRRNLALQREEFISQQVSFQLGELKISPTFEPTDVQCSPASKSSLFLFYDPTKDRIRPESWSAHLRRRDSDGEWTYDRQGPKPRGHRNAEFLNDMRRFGLGCPVVANMQDSVHEENTAFPVFQYNRRGGCRNSILWPLNCVHALGSRSFCSLPDPAERPLKEKSPVVFWRGAMVGTTNIGNRHANAHGMVKSFVEGKIGRDIFFAQLQSISRYRFVSMFHDAEGFDVGFHHSRKTFFHRSGRAQNYAEVPELVGYEKPGASPAEQAQSRYVVCLRGNDVGSSFGWQIGTSCVILKEEYPWEVFFYAHFKPWEHYVPISPDFRDVPAKVEWCENNLDACEEMNRKRHALIPLLLERQIREEAMQRVVRRYEDFCRQSGVS
ncbi:MAG TPA: glycosyl transferase family 90 [Rhizomicrobium sp.]